MNLNEWICVNLKKCQKVRIVFVDKNFGCYKLLISNVNQSLEAVEQGLCRNETRNDLRGKIFMNRKEKCHHYNLDESNLLKEN